MRVIPSTLATTIKNIGTIPNEENRKIMPSSSKQQPKMDNLFWNDHWRKC